jgi:hypothetical protein
MWRAVELLQALPAGRSVGGRWDADRDAFSAYAEHLDTIGLPQPRHDSAVAAAQRLNWLERAQATYDAQRAFDDPLVMAEYRMSGEAFAGTVTAALPNRLDTSGTRRKLRPHVTVSTMDPVLVEPGARVTAPTRLRQEATVVSVTRAQSGVDVVIELTGGMGRKLTPEPGSVPEVGEQLCYTTLTDSYKPPGTFPDRDNTPWTHGGPPAAYVPVDEDATEEWS